MKESAVCGLRCFALFLVSRDEYERIRRGLPACVIRRAVGGGVVLLYPRGCSVVPEWVGEREVVVLWSSLRWLIEKLWGSGWEVRVYLRDDIETKVRVGGGFSNFREYLDAVEDAVSGLMVWPSGYPDVAHYLKVWFRPPGRSAWAAIRYTSVFCFDDAFLGSGYFDEFLRALLSVLR